MARRAVVVMVISLSFSCVEQVRCELACGPSYVSVVAVARLCAQPAQCAIFSFCALCSDAMGALEFVGCARRQWRETTALTVYREESSPFQLTCSPAEADIGQVRSSNLAIAAMMAYEGVQPRGRFVKMADDDVRDVAVGAVSTRDGRTSRISKWGIRRVHSLSTTTADPAAGSRHACSQRPLRRTGCDSCASNGPVWDSPVAQKTRSYSGWADDMVTIANALGYHEFGVTGWSEGGPWALAAAAYIDPARLRHISSIAGGSYGTFGDNWAAQYLSKIDAFGGALALRFKPGFRLMYASLGITAEYFRGQLRQTTAEIRQRLRPTDSASAARSQRPSATHAPNASHTVATDWFATLNSSIGVGLSTSRRSTGESICGKDWTIDLSRIPSTRRWLTECPESVWHPVEGAGHFVAVGAGDEVFAIAAEELGAP